MGPTTGAAAEEEERAAAEAAGAGAAADAAAALAMGVRRATKRGEAVRVNRALRSMGENECAQQQVAELLAFK